MATITIDYDARNNTVQKLIDVLLSFSSVRIKNEAKQPKYNQAMIDKVNGSRKQFREGKYKIIKTEDLWK